MKGILENKKTWIGLIIAVVGMLGLPSWISGTELTEALNQLFQFVGSLVAIYGNYDAHKRLKAKPAI